MNVASNSAFRLERIGKTGKLDVLAKRVDRIGDNCLYGLALDLACAQRIKIGWSVLENSLRDLFRICTELLVHTDEVGLAVKLNERACMRIVGNERNHCAFVRSATSLLSNGSKTCRTQNVDCLIHVAISFDECLLAFHHACTGHFAEFFYHSGANLCHSYFLSFKKGRLRNLNLPRTNVGS